MVDLFIASTLAGANQLAHVVALLHDLPKRGTHFGGGVHVDMPDVFTPGMAHPGWSVRPHPNVRRLHPILDQWGTLIREDTQALWADEETREERLEAGHIQTFTTLFSSATALNATWNAGVPQPDLHQVGSSNIVTKGADPTGVANSTAAIMAARNEAGANGVVEVPFGTYKINSETFQTLSGQRIVGPGTFVAANAGQWLCYGGVPSYIECKWDGANLVQDVVLIDQASVTFNGEATRATRYGIRVHRALCDITARVSNCGSHGAYFHGANGTVVRSLHSIGNGGLGFEAVGRFDPASFAADPLLNAGDITLERGVFEQNALGGFRLLGVEGGSLHRMRCESGANVGVVKNSHCLQIRDFTGSGGSNDPDHAFLLIDNSNAITVDGAHTNSGNGLVSHARIELAGDCHGFKSRSCFFFSDIASTELWPVARVLGNGTIGAGSQAITLSGISLTGADVNRHILVYGAGAGGAIFESRIQSVQSATQAILVNQAPSLVTGAAVRLYRTAVVS